MSRWSAIIGRAWDRDEGQRHVVGQRAAGPALNLGQQRVEQPAARQATPGEVVDQAGQGTDAEPLDGTRCRSALDQPSVYIDAFSRRAGGIDAAAKVLSQDPAFVVAVFTQADDLRLMLQALRVGVRGDLLKSTPPEELVDMVVRLHEGDVVIDPALATDAAVLAARTLTSVSGPAPTSASPGGRPSSSRCWPRD